MPRTASTSKSPTRRALAVVVCCLAIGASSAAACGSGGGPLQAIPPSTGNEIAPITPFIGADELARRSAAERERGHLARAERFARWALAREPEHPGALVAMARVARDMGDHDGARRSYALAAMVDEGAARAIAAERGAALLAYARAELAAKRVEQAAALVVELEQATPRFVSAERQAVAALHGELADIWLARGLARAGREEAERASQLGAERERTRVRLLQAEILEADAGARGGASALGPLEGRLQAELGQDGEHWVWMADWANRLRRHDTAEWAARRAIDIDKDEANAWAALCEALLGSEKQDDALPACMEAAQRMEPEAGAALLLRHAERFDSVHVTIAAAKAAADRAPGTAAGIRAAALAAFRELGLPEPAGGEEPGPRARAIGTLELAVSAAPEAWLQVIAPAQAKGDVRAVARVLAAARAAGLKSWVAHVFEHDQWQQVRRGSASPELRAEAEAGAAAAFDAAVAAAPGIVGQIELARLARGDADKTAKVEALAERTGLGAVMRAYLAAVGSRGEVAARRATLAAGLAAADAFTTAWTRAHFELEAGQASEALGQAEAAVSAAAPEERGAAEAFALRLALSQPPPVVEARARPWLGAGGERESIEEPQRCATLLKLVRSTRGDREINELVHAAILDEERCRWSFDLAQIHSQTIALLQKLERWDEVEARWNARLDALDDARVATQELVAWAGQEHPAMMLRFAARLHPAEIDRREALADVVKDLVAQAEPIRARRVAEHILTLSDGDGIGAPRLLAMGQDLLDASGSARAAINRDVGYLDLAARTFERLVRMGDRSSKVYAGWLKALLRLGDDAGAAMVVERWMDARQRRDARPTEDVVKALLEEGRSNDAIALYEQRLETLTRLEPSSFNALADLYARVGRPDGLGPLAERFIAGDTRMRPRLTVATAMRFVEVGAYEEASAVLEAGLARHPRDSTMLSQALNLALTSGSEAEVVATATKLLREIGGSFDAWEGVIADVRGSARPEVAEALVENGLERFPGAHRLLALRGNVLLPAGEAEAAFHDFAEALARAPAPKDVLDPLEPMLERMGLFERLADLETRALALAPGRADTMLTLGRVLTAAGRVEEATQLFEQVVSGTDRAHGLVAQAWYQAGYLGMAVDAWAKLEPTLADDAVTMLDNVATALGRRGEGERLDTFVRLYLQALRGASSPPLLLIGEAYRKVGRPEDALRWLERADRESPSVDSVLALMRLRLAMGDRAGALAAAERAVTRRVALAAPGRAGQMALAPALDAMAQEAIALGHPAVARELATRVAATHGESTGTRLVTARALMAEGAVAPALALLELPFEPWRQQRDVIAILRGALEDVAAHGHLEAALGIALRALEAGNEREILVGALRIAVRAGHAEDATVLAQRLTALQPALNGWLAGDVLASERLARPAEVMLTRAIGQASGDAALKQAALALTLLRGGDFEALDGVVAAIPRAAQDRIERANIEGFVAAALPDERAPERALTALLPVMRRAAVDPAQSRLAALMASFVGARAVEGLLAVLRSANAAEVKTRIELGRYLVGAQRLEAALVMLDPLLESHGGDGQLALEVFAVALRAGDEARARRWADKALGSSAEAAPPTLRLMFADQAARSGAVALARELIGPDSGDGWRRQVVRARLALVEGDVAAFDGALEQGLLVAPDEAVARVEMAELALVARGGEAEWREVALRLVQPLLVDEGAPAGALEVACAASREGKAALAHLRRLARHYPGVVERATLLVHGALETADRELIDALLAAIPLPRRRALLVDELETRLAAGAGGGGLPAPVVAAVEAQIAAAPPTDAGAVRLEIALARLSGDGVGAVRAAESAVARAPHASELALTLAETLVDTGGDLGRAEALVREQLARPVELGLFDAEKRFLTPSWNPRAWEVLARIHLRRGEPERARQALARARAVAPEHEQTRLGLSWARANDDPARMRTAFAECAARDATPWAMLCGALWRAAR